MRIQLPDVNILIALHDETHYGHLAAHNWLVTEGRFGWATCPLTQNGFLRLFALPALPNNVGSVSAAMTLLRDLMQDNGNVHHFWADNLSLFDTSLFSMDAALGRKQLADLYLLGLCQQNGGTFVTLDTRITTNFVVAPHLDLLRTLVP